MYADIYIGHNHNIDSIQFEYDSIEELLFKMVRKCPHELIVFFGGGWRELKWMEKFQPDRLALIPTFEQYIKVENILTGNATYIHYDYIGNSLCGVFRDRHPDRVILYGFDEKWKTKDIAEKERLRNWFNVNITSTFYFDKDNIPQLM
jgi:hypothetical protein